MGLLKPGAEYVYEYERGIVYARERGQESQERFIIGWKYVPMNTASQPVPIDE